MAPTSPVFPAEVSTRRCHFDAFVHLEPWEIFRYLEIARTLLREGGIGIVHFSDVETPIGFRLFQSQVPGVVERGVDFANVLRDEQKHHAPGFSNELGFEIVTITNEIMPRDAVAVFRRKRGIAESVPLRRRSMTVCRRDMQPSAPAAGGRSRPEC